MTLQANYHQLQFLTIANQSSFQKLVGLDI